MWSRYAASSRLTAPAAAAGKGEGLQRLEILLALIHERLESLDLGFAHPMHALVDRVIGRGQLAAQVEELVLDPTKDPVEPAVRLALLQALCIKDPCETDDGVELVDGAVGLDARRVLGDAAPAHEPRIALVAGASVDAGETNGHVRGPPARRLAH